MKPVITRPKGNTINVLIVEPDAERCERLVACLPVRAGFNVVGAGDDPLYACQLPILRRSPVGVLLLNADRPEMAGPSMWAVIRFLLKGTRIAALTKGSDDRILEAALGAGVTALHPLDVEPYILRRAVRNAAKGVVDYDPDLIERARRVLLRPLEETQIRFGGLTIDLQMREVTRWGIPIHLTPLEFDVLAHLARKRGRWVSTTELLEAVWHTPAGKGGTADQVKGCIKRLRRKIEPNAKHPRYLRSVRGWGYRLENPLQGSPT